MVQLYRLEKFEFFSEHFKILKKSRFRWFLDIKFRITSKRDILLRFLFEYFTVLIETYNFDSILHFRKLDRNMRKLNLKISKKWKIGNFRLLRNIPCKARKALSLYNGFEHLQVWKFTSEDGSNIDKKELYWIRPINLRVTNFHTVLPNHQFLYSVARQRSISNVA